MFANRILGGVKTRLLVSAAAGISLLLSAHKVTAACPTSAPQNVTFTYNGPTSHCGGQTKNLCTPGELVQFTASAFNYTFTTCDQFMWNFGDGSTPATSQNPAHAFPAAGRYTVELQVSNSLGMSTDELTVTAGEVPAPIINSFKPSSLVVDAGRVSHLEWSFTGATSGTLLSCPGGSGCTMLSTVTRQQGTFDVNPSSTTMYELVVGPSTSIAFVQVVGNGHPSGTPVGTTAGTGTQTGFADGGLGVAQFNHPTAVALDPTTYVDSIGLEHFNDQVVIDGSGYTVRRVSSGGVVSTIAGHTGSIGFQNGPGTLALFDFTGEAAQPAGGVAVDADGNIFVADSANHVIREIDRRNNVSTYAGGPTMMGYQDGARLSALFFFPTSLAFGPDGTLYVADTGNHVIRAIANDEVKTFAGVAGPGGYADGAAGSALFTLPHGLAVDPLGAVYVTELNANRLRRISAGTVTTFVGEDFTQGNSGAGPNPFNFGSGGGLAVLEGILYVANTNNQTILRVSAGSAPTLVAGKISAAGWVDGVGSKAQFNGPDSLGVTSDGYLTVADTQNQVLRKVFVPEPRDHSVSRP